MKVFNLLIISLLILPIATASCLTDTEIINIRLMAVNSSANPDIIQNLYERLCNSDYTNQQINSFNSSIQAQINSINQNITNSLSQIQGTFNNSALALALTQIANMYNASVTVTNSTQITISLISESEAKINARMDNQSSDILNQFNTFKTEINQNVIDKQSNALSTNRLIYILLGVVALVCIVIYFGRNKIKSYVNINHLPHDHGLTAPLSIFNDDQEANNTSKNKRVPARKTQ